MPLTPKQTSNIQTGLQALFPKELNWTTEGRPDGSCDKIVVINPTVSKSDLFILSDLVKKQKCDFLIKPHTKGISISFK